MNLVLLLEEQNKMTEVSNICSEFMKTFVGKDAKSAESGVQKYFDSRNVTKSLPNNPGGNSRLTKASPEFIGNNLTPIYKLRYDELKSRNGDQHPDTLAAMHEAAYVYMKARDLSSALHLSEGCFTMRSVVLGSDSPLTMASLHLQALILMELEQWQRAKDAFMSLVEVGMKSFDEQCDDKLFLYYIHDSLLQSNMIQEKISSEFSKNGPYVLPKLDSALYSMIVELVKKAGVNAHRMASPDYVQYWEILEK